MSKAFITSMSKDLLAREKSAGRIDSCHDAKGKLVRTMEVKAPAWITHLCRKLHDGPINTWRHRTLAILESTPLEIIILLASLFDLMSFMVELTVDHYIGCDGVEKGSHSAHGLCDAVGACHLVHVLDKIGLVILICMIVELLLKFSLSPRRFVTHAGNMIDALSIGLSALFTFSPVWAEFAGGILFLRLWRTVNLTSDFYKHFHAMVVNERVLEDAEESLHLCVGFIEKQALLDMFEEYCLAEVAEDNSVDRMPNALPFSKTKESL